MSFADFAYPQRPQRLSPAVRRFDRLVATLVSWTRTLEQRWESKLEHPAAPVPYY